MNALAKTYDRSYYVGGKKSNYADYRQKKYRNLAKLLFRKYDLEGKKVIDFGCATGALIYELKKLGVKVKGTDASPWALAYGKKEYGLDDRELRLLDYTLLLDECEVLLFLDVLEHLPDDQLMPILNYVSKQDNKKHIIVRIPVCKEDGGPYILPISENDKTHVGRRTKESWISLFNEKGYKLQETLKYEPIIWDSEGVLCAEFVREENGKRS